jgi:hypothetical protein
VAAIEPEGELFFRRGGVGGMRRVERRKVAGGVGGVGVGVGVS